MIRVGLDQPLIHVVLDLQARQLEAFCRIQAENVVNGLRHHQDIGWTPPVAHARSPPDILVVAQSIDDILSLDPAEGFELSSLQIENNVYQRLVEPDPDHPEVLNPILAAS